MTACSYHVTYAFYTLHSCSWLNVKELLGWNRHNIRSLNDYNKIWTHNHLVCKQALNDLAKMAKKVNKAKWLNVRLQTKCLWVWIFFKLLAKAGKVLRFWSVHASIHPSNLLFLNSSWAKMFKVGEKRCKNEVFRLFCRIGIIANIALIFCKNYTCKKILVHMLLAKLLSFSQIEGFCDHQYESVC